jgi:ribosomal protein S19E (S16A)
MSPENVAILKSLAIRPSPSIATSVRSMVEALEQSGYVANGPDGWSTTAKGCELLEQRRVSALLGSRNQPQPPPL